MDIYYLYILKCSNGALYTGITTDITRRLAEHNGEGRGAKYTAAHKPVELVYEKQFIGRSAASIEEARIKKLSRIEKLLLIKSSQ
jgi:putative endonuclease